MSKDKLNILADRAAARALKNIRKSDSEIEDDSISFVDTTEEVDIEAITEFDIFDYCENEFIKKGDFIEYTIKKNGATVGFKKHPYSWEKIQREFGGGRYKVIAKSNTTGQIVKNQTQAMEELPNDDKKSNSFDPASLVAQIAEAVKPKNDGLGIAELMALMDRTSDKAKNEAQTQNQTMMTMMQENTKMMMIMMQNMFQQSKPEKSHDLEMFTLIEKLTDKMDNKIERLVDKIQANQKNPNEFGLLDVIKMREEAQEKGYKMSVQLNQLAENKAQQKLDLIEEYRSEDGGKKEKSMTETLIETMLPTIAGALAAPKLNPQAPRQIAPQPARRPNPINNGGRTQTNSNKQLPQASFKGQEKSNETTREVVRENPRENSQSVSLKKPVLPTVNFDKKEAEIHIIKDQEFIDKTTELLIPVFVDGLTKEIPPTEVSPNIIETLAINGISREVFLNKVQISDILDIVKGYGLPEVAYPWFEEIYANIKNRTDSSIGEQSQSIGG